MTTAAEFAIPPPGIGAEAVPAARAEAGSRAWPRAIAAFVLVVWLIPITSYRLPISLPFNLEVYRVMILGMVFAWLLAAMRGEARLLAGGLGRPVALVALASAGSIFVNINTVQSEGLFTQALKILSYFLSLLIAFLLVSSTIRTLQDIDTVIIAIVVGAVLVGIGAIVESRTRYNVFDHLQSFVPFLKHDRADALNLRDGRLRVHASARHPIALAAALSMAMPLALYLARRATSTRASRLWLLATLPIIAGVAATQSRTGVLMIGAMTLLGLWLRRKSVVRRWPLLVVLLLGIHLAAPQTLGSLYHALNPKGGLVQEQEVRGGLQGSGRLADLKPGYDLWKKSPVLGQGIGTEPTVGSVSQTPSAQSSSSIIFDDQYMTSLVENGAVGLFAVVWLVFGVVVKLVRAARRVPDVGGDLVAACAISCFGFVVGMLTYDAFSFVQVTLLFFVAAALGLKARSLLMAAPEVAPEAT